jgi:hypothetical protein
LIEVNIVEFEHFVNQHKKLKINISDICDPAISTYNDYHVGRKTYPDCVMAKIVHSIPVRYYIRKVDK